MKQRIESIYFLRLFAMLMVVLVHVTGAYVEVLTFNTDAYQKYHFINRIIRIEAGIFIMITGLVFFYNYIRKPLTGSVLKNYYQKRVTYILIPYLVWAIIYELYSAYIGVTNLNLNDVMSRILQGKSYYQLHFIFLIVQFYLFFPIFIYLAQKIALFRKYMWAFGILFEVGYYLLNTKYQIIPFNFFLDAFGTFLLGGWIGLYYQEQKEKMYARSNIILFILTICAGWVTVTLNYYAYTIDQIQISDLLYKLVNLTYLFIGGYFLFRMTEILAHRLPRKTVEVVKNIAVYSFGFYLLHPLVLNAIVQVVPAENNYWFHIQILTRYVLTVIFCYIIIWATHKFFLFPSIIFGKMPQEAVFLYKKEKTS
ncbi:acyltransferase [Bacillus sp. CGMCC 1.16541]|uniref:acyltransferase n=1 Tax=Bacillus sp. CGMCC 1.16541 TaxID=2185143 RepID=UPI001EF3F546|nr:acyltransferase [Bacillus sp. CGMCC 1.16541]